MARRAATANSPTSSRTRSDCERSSQADTSSSVAGRTSASWNGRLSPSSSAPSPRATRIRTVPGRSIALASCCSMRSDKHLAEPDLAAGVDRHVTAGLKLKPVQRRLVLEPVAVDRGSQR